MTIRKLHVSIPHIDESLNQYWYYKFFPDSWPSHDLLLGSFLHKKPKGSQFAVIGVPRLGGNYKIQSDDSPRIVLAVKQIQTFDLTV